jgi:hypothetical protein
MICYDRTLSPIGVLKVRVKKVIILNQKSSALLKDYNRKAPMADKKPRFYFILLS